MLQRDIKKQVTDTKAWRTQLSSGWRIVFSGENSNIAANQTQQHRTSQPDKLKIKCHQKVYIVTIPSEVQS